MDNRTRLLSSFPFSTLYSSLVHYTNSLSSFVFCGLPRSLHSKTLALATWVCTNSCYPHDCLSVSLSSSLLLEYSKTVVPPVFFHRLRLVPPLDLVSCCRFRICAPWWFIPPEYIGFTPSQSVPLPRTDSSTVSDWPSVPTSVSASSLLTFDLLRCCPSAGSQCVLLPTRGSEGAHAVCRPLKRSRGLRSHFFPSDFLFLTLFVLIHLHQLFQRHRLDNPHPLFHSSG